MEKHQYTLYTIYWNMHNILVNALKTSIIQCTGKGPGYCNTFSILISLNLNKKYFQINNGFAGYEVLSGSCLEPSDWAADTFE